MDQKTFDKLVVSTLADCKNLLVSKGAEYAGPTDRLGNFKRGAATTGVQPETVAFVYMSKHFDSVATFVRHTETNDGDYPTTSEPIGGRLDDLINYCILLKALIADKS